VFSSTDRVGPVHVAFTDRHGGVSAPPYDSLNLGRSIGDRQTHVDRNLQLVASALGAVSSQIVLMDQVHGSNVTVIDGPGDPSPRADAMVTTSPRVVLCVRAADCMPVLLADPEAAVIGCVHAGRLGMTSGVVPNALEQMRALGATNITAWIGPYVCGSCYEVPATLRAEVADVVPESFAQTSWGTPALDIGAGIRAQLVDAGCSVVDRARCTFEDPNLFSYRREGGASGRLGGLIRLAL
jgi:YfiH family protein